MEKAVSASRGYFRSDITASYGKQLNSDLAFICVLQIVSPR